MPGPVQVPTDKYLSYFPELMPKVPYIMASPKTFLGLEVEIENVMRVGPNVLNSLWAVKADHSLRNNGNEFVTPGVISASVAESALKLLFQELNPDIDFSKRTSIHVHLDARQFSVDQLMSFLFTYIVIENLLFKFVGNNRRNNIFCVPIVETNLMERIMGKPVEFVTGIGSYWHKYSALNLLPITTFGSIEFRHMPGTTNIQHLLQWIDLILCMKVYAYKYSLNNILEEIIHLNSNSRYKQFIESIFGERCVYLDVSNLLNDMEKQVYLIKHCGMTNMFHQKVVHCANSNSQLGAKMSNWLQKLSVEQRESLAFIANILAIDDLEQCFRQVVLAPATFAVTDELKHHVTILLKAKITKEIKTELFTWQHLISPQTEDGSS